jgi:hypothetical protein
MPEVSWVVITYGVYLAIGLRVIAAVAQVQSSQGRVFLADAFRGNEPLAGATGNLMSTGFHLIAFGFLTLTLKESPWPPGVVSAFEATSSKVGVLLFVLAALHYASFWVFARMRHEAMLADAPPPVAPDEVLP